MHSQMLAESVEFLNNKHGASGSGQSVYACRTFLGRLVENFLTNMDKVAAALKKDGTNSEYTAPLQFCGIFLRDRTEVFLPPPRNQCPSTPPLNKPVEILNEEDLTQEFLLWVLSRILVLLGQKKCEDMHERSMATIHQILQTVKWRDAFFYGKILKELLLCVTDLVKVSEDMFEDRIECGKLVRYQVNMDKVLHSLQEPEKRKETCEVKLSAANFSVDDIFCCELMQINFTKVLCGVATDLNKFCFDTQVNALWASMCYQVQNGDVAMKTESMKLLAELLKYTRVPLEVEEYFLVCDTGLLELLSTGLPLVEGITAGEIQGLEKSTAAVFNNIVALGERLFFSSYPRVLYNLLIKMAAIFEANSLAKFQTYELKFAISAVLCEIQEQLSPQYMLSWACKSQRSQLIAALINEICFSKDLQYLVGPLVKAVLCDLSVKCSDLETEVKDKMSRSEENDEQASKTAGGNLNRKRKLDDGSKAPSRGVQQLSITYKVMKYKLELVLQQDVQDDVCLKMEGVRIIVEVMATCVQLYSQKNTEPGRHRQASEFSKVTSWLSAECWNDICGLFFRALQFLSVTENPDVHVASCFMSMLRILGALLSVQEQAEYDPDMYQNFGWVASLPWLLNDPSWVDLKPVNARDIVKIASVLVPKLGGKCSAECLNILSLLPKEVAPKWKVHVFRQALSDTTVEVKRAAIDVFPILLYHLGPNANHLVYDLLHPCVEDKVDKILRVLAKIAGPLACVVSRKAVLSKSSEISMFCPMYKKISVSCLSCDCAEVTDVTGSSVDRPKLVDANMFQPFLQLVNSQQSSIRLALIGSMRRMFGHIGVRKNNAATINVLNLALILIEDADYDNRTAFSKIIQYLLGDMAEEGSEGTNELVLTKLRETFSKAQKEGNARMQETVLLTIAQLGRISEGEMLVVVIIVLLESMLSSTPLVAATAHEQLKDIATHKETKTQNLFMRCRHDVCKFLVEAMHDAQSGKIGKSADDILVEVSQVLGFSDVKTFLTGTEKYIVPYLVSKGTAAASNLIKLIATQLSVASRSRLLINNTKYVFSYLVRHKQKESLQTAIHYLQKETKFELRDLLRLDFQRVHNELLLHLSTNYSEVFHGLKILSTYDASYKGGEITTPEEMADYLQPRLLGVLAHFDSQLMNASLPMEEKRPALESLISIIRLMGSKNISGIRHKVMNTLRIGLQFTDKAFIEISCRAWNCFVRSLELPFLGQMLAIIVATLLPLLKQLPKQVAEIFNYMIVENRNALKSHFHDIYFLPDMAELSDANAILKQYTDGPSSQSDFNSILQHTMQGIQHESSDVRLHALSKLKNLLKDERKAFFQLVMENETADPTISRLISLLLKGFRETDVNAQILYAECLGNCSAIDPGRLELATNNPKSDLAKLHVSIHDDKFAVALISEVVKSYLAAPEPRIQDCSAYALQELLTIYKISETSEDESSKKLWNDFPEHVQEILIPFLTSKYILATKHDWDNLQKPIYCSKKGHTFKDWVSTWTGYLSSKIKVNSKPYEVFKSCSAVINFDTHIAIYILPFVVLHVLQDGSEDDVSEICAEINEVLNQGARGDGKPKGSSFHHMSAQTVFSVLDYLTKWKYFMLQMNMMKAAEALKKKTAPSLVSATDIGYNKVKEFLDRIPQDKIAQVSFSCKAYTRAVMHFEQHLNGKANLSKEELDFMQRLYVELDEPDGVQGVAAIRQAPPSLQERILTFSGRVGCQVELQACYEKAIDADADDVTNHQGLLRCFMDLGQPSLVLHHATGVIVNRKSWVQQLVPFQVEAAWKLAKWTDLEHFTKVDKTSRKWPVMLGRILLAAKAKKEEDFLQHLRIARQDQVGPLSAASFEMGSYQRGYEYIVRLHLLNEIEENMEVFMNLGQTEGAGGQSKISGQDLLSHWQTRLKVMQSSFRIQEPVLTMRRTLMTLTQQEGHSDLDLDREIGHSWLSSAKIAHKTGYLQSADSFLLQASEFNLPEFGLQKAKWHWEKGEHDQAVSLLEREMEHHFSNVPQLKADTSEGGNVRRKVYAKARLLYGRYCEETSKIESNAIMKQYKEVIDIAPDWEHGHFYLGKYFDKIMTALVDDSKQGEFVVHVVKNLGTSLHYGNQFIYQSLPRLLSLWLDFGTSVVNQEKRERSKSAPSVQALQKNVNSLSKLNNMIGSFGKTLAPYQLFFAFSQLTSRICHAHNDVFQQLKMLIARLVVSYPQQALWLLMAVSKSSYQMRAKRCQEIFATAREMDPNLTKVIQDYIKLTERLLELCEKDLPQASTASIDKNFRPLKRLLEDDKFTPILLPLQSSMTVSLPNTVDKRSQHNPFPANLVYIKGFEDTVEILASLQKPKKITMRGSDGRLYVMMCKPKDDLRKDCRLMEFNGIVNKFLRKDPESRKRYLYIRTYTVIPLNEECGLIEWVNNTSGLRHILMKLYKEKGLYTSGNDLKAMMPAVQAPKEAKLNVYKNKLLPRHPPVFGEWFLRTFPDPTSWYNARLAYCKTVAVMSMVGYILGLGDRHGENILFDSTSGDCIHVDLNCLFNRGETFEWPEKVPFRLTHNLIHAMGPLKLEGIFRRACEVTLRVMRKESEPLMSVLKPFVYDPLVEWSKPSKGHRQNPTESGEITNEQGRVHVQNIEQRLQGILNKGTKRSGLPLSVEGHVNHLIQEATDEGNLCQMYIGWAAYL